MSWCVFSKIGNKQGVKKLAWELSRWESSYWSDTMHIFFLFTEISKPNWVSSQNLVLLSAVPLFACIASCPVSCNAVMTMAHPLREPCRILPRFHGAVRLGELALSMVLNGSVGPELQVLPGVRCIWWSCHQQTKLARGSQQAIAHAGSVVRISCPCLPVTCQVDFLLEIDVTIPFVMHEMG